MDAPLYPPATAYVAPERVAHKVDSYQTSIADLLANPDTKAILLREIPGFEGRVGNSALKPHLGNFSLRSLVQFGVFKAEQLDKVDVFLRALPPVKGAAK
jgi:hypothetical protein